MKTILAHGCYESFLGEGHISNHPVGNLLLLVFSADKITVVPIHQVLVHTGQGLDVRCLNRT